MTSITSNMYPIKGYSLDDVEYYPDLQIIPPKQEREKVAFKSNVQPAPTGIVGSFRSFPAEVVNIQPNDVILLRISDDLDLHTCSEIQKEMNETEAAIIEGEDDVVELMDQDHQEFYETIREQKEHDEELFEEFINEEEEE